MVKNVMTGTYTRNDEEVATFDFYTELSASNKVKFVNSVISILVDEDYNSIIRDLIFDYMIIDVFTTVDISDIENSANFLDDAEEFLAETNIVDIVKANMEIGLLEELNKAVDLGIEYRTGIHTNPLNEALTSLINTIDTKVNEVDLNSMMEMATKFTGMTDEFTPENIVNAYMNSDIYKKNVEEIANSKEAKSKIVNDVDKVISMVDKVDRDEKVDKKSKNPTKTTIKK